MSVNSTSMYNPYAMMYGLNAQNGLSDDFMWNAYLANSQNSQTGAQNPSFSGANLSGQPSTNCYQSSTGSGLGTGIKLGLAGGAGVGLGMYYFGGDKVNPIVNGKFTDQVLKAVEEDYKVAAKNIETTRLNSAVEKAIKDAGHFDSIEQYNATRIYLTTPDAERGNLPQEILNKVHPQAKIYKNVYGNKLTLTEQAINGVDVEKIKNEALIEAQQNHLGYQSEYLAELKKRQSLVNGLAKDATRAQYEELIKQNPKAFGIVETETAAIEAEAKRIAQGFTTKDAAVTSVLGEINSTTTNLGNIRTTLNGRYTQYLDETAKGLSESAPPELAKAVKNVKFNKAGKAGLIAAGAGLVLGWLFG